MVRVAISKSSGCCLLAEVGWKITKLVCSPFSFARKVNVVCIMSRFAEVGDAQQQPVCPGTRVARSSGDRR